MNIHSPSSNRLSQLDVVLALENLRTLHEEELANRKKKEEVRKTIEWPLDIHALTYVRAEMFLEISGLKEEVQDLKTLVKSLMSKMKGGNDKTNVTLDSYLHETGVEQANNAIEGIDEASTKK